MKTQGEAIFQCLECLQPTVPYSEVTIASEFPSQLNDPEAESTRIIEHRSIFPLFPTQSNITQRRTSSTARHQCKNFLQERLPSPFTSPRTTQREKRKLVSSDGYTYVDKKENKSGSIVLRCSVRNSKTTCRATVLQHGDTFTTNSKEHTYASKPGNLLRRGKGARSVLRGIRIHGCAFHWGQAVWRHVQGAGVTCTSNFV